jgi:hypothetical protein
MSLALQPLPQVVRISLRLAQEVECLLRVAAQDRSGLLILEQLQAGAVRGRLGTQDRG